MSHPDDIATLHEWKTGSRASSRSRLIPGVRHPGPAGLLKA